MTQLELQANPTISTILEVEEILAAENRATATPMSFAEVERRMHAKKTKRETVKAAVQALAHFGVVYVGPKGIIYTRTPHNLVKETVALA
ncbi:MAG: hypothetical protein ACYDBQ_09795 [Thermoplasmatota archaeon]